MKCISAVLACVVVAAVGVSLRAATAPKQISFAKAAQIAGVVVGKDTVEDLEKRLGPGAPCLGGHPHGGRVWYVKSQNVYVYADGFDYNDKGRILDQLSVSKEPGGDFDYEIPRPKIPSINVSKEKLGWMGKVLPGMSRSELLKQTAGLPKPKSENGDLIWEIEGKYGKEPVDLKIQATLKKDVVVDVWLVTR